jgi:hypothetical protein
MYTSSLYFHFIATRTNHQVLQMFFENWADSICNNEVKYSVVGGDGGGLTSWNDIIRVDFVNEEDATLMKLKGVPEEFQKYLKLVDWYPVDKQACPV